jgi:hypothetical protein
MPPTFDVQIPLMSLPRAFKTTLANVPAPKCYVHAAPDSVAAWKNRLDPVAIAPGGFRIGINWQGNPSYTFDRYRSFPLAELSPIAQIPGVQLVSLQKMHGLDQLENVKDQFNIVDLSNELDVHAAPFLDTAAVMKNLDLVITSDSAVAHLAGAMGVPVWVATSFAAEWRWLTDREDSPWYPSMRLFRQPAIRDWQSVFRRMAKELMRQREAITT